MKTLDVKPAHFLFKADRPFEGLAALLRDVDFWPGWRDILTAWALGQLKPHVEVPVVALHVGFDTKHHGVLFEVQLVYDILLHQGPVVLIRKSGENWTPYSVRSQGFNNFVQSVCDEYQALCERMGLRKHGRPPYTRGDFMQFAGDLERREEEAEAE